MDYRVIRLRNFILIQWVLIVPLTIKYVPGIAKPSGYLSVWEELCGACVRQSQGDCVGIPQLSRSVGMRQPLVPVV